MDWVWCVHRWTHGIDFSVAERDGYFPSSLLLLLLLLQEFFLFTTIILRMIHLMWFEYSMRMLHLSQRRQNRWAIQLEIVEKERQYFHYVTFMRLHEHWNQSRFYNNKIANISSSTRLQLAFTKLTSNRGFATTNRYEWLGFRPHRFSFLHVIFPKCSSLSSNFMHENRIEFCWNALSSTQFRQAHAPSPVYYDEELVVYRLPPGSFVSIRIT